MHEEPNISKFETGDLNNIKEKEEQASFESLYKKYSEEVKYPETIHEFAKIDIGKKEKNDMCNINVININPEIKIEDYSKKIEKVLS